MPLSEGMVALGLTASLGLLALSLPGQTSMRLTSLLRLSPQPEEATLPHVGYFLRSMDLGTGGILQELSLSDADAAALEGVSHFRLAPAIFPDGMGYHFDGLATVLKFEFSGGKLHFTAKAYESDAEKSYKSCLFVGTGTGPTLGSHACLTNPGVNLLPIEGQLWLTIDTSKWGRVDPKTLNTLPDSVKVPSTVLNAHPACDRGTCFVQYNCGGNEVPLTNQACFGVLKPGDRDMDTVEISRATLPKEKLIQHSHSPCITTKLLISKLDAFVARNPLNAYSGILHLMHQGEDNLWLVMDRQTNKSRVMTSDASFVNNHFWNCFEDGGDAVVDAVASTEDYLDNYFSRNLDQPKADWAKLFHPPLRCRIPATGDRISCENFFKAEGPVFDYPTFNPKFKMNPNYQFFYAIAPKSTTARWFDSLIKVDVQSRAVSKSWAADGIFFTEADFIPRKSSLSEDDGILISVLYNTTSDKSTLGLFDASSLALVGQYELSMVVPFHAHGIVCEGSKPCYTNP